MPHPAINHVILLMLENRSFDHMFGFLNHPKPLTKLRGDESNAGFPGQPPVTVSATAQPSIAVDPNHRHFGVMRQLLGIPPTGDPPLYRPPYNVTNSGFVWDYEMKCADEGHTGYGPTIMECFDEQQVPVLSRLAKDFAICDHWFCSVPGQTWPNRNFLHAGTSDGTTNNKKRLYTNRTIFEALSDAGKSWTIYHHGDPQTLVFPKLWDRPWKRKRFEPIAELWKRLADGKLPNYTFIEPNHLGSNTNSQHPGNNSTSSADFLAGERLIRRVYQGLIANQDLWKKSVVIILYDEHGGFYDHERPPIAIPPDDHISPERFGFDLLGVRVPAVIISAYTAPETVDPTPYDHTSIISSLREQFGIAAPLTRRDAAAPTIWKNLKSGAMPRLAGDIPTLEGPEFTALDEPVLAAEQAAAGLAQPEDDDLDMAWLFQQVERVLNQEELSPAAGIEDFSAAASSHAVPEFATKEQISEYAKGVMNRFESSAE